MANSTTSAASQVNRAFPEAPSSTNVHPQDYVPAVVESVPGSRTSAFLSASRVEPGPAITRLSAVVLHTQSLISSFQESHRSLQESHRSLQESHRSLQQSHRSLQESHRAIQQQNLFFRFAPFLRFLVEKFILESTNAKQLYRRWHPFLPITIRFKHIEKLMNSSARFSQRVQESVESSTNGLVWEQVDAFLRYSYFAQPVVTSGNIVQTLIEYFENNEFDRFGWHETIGRIVSTFQV